MQNLTEHSVTNTLNNQYFLPNCLATNRAVSTASTAVRFCVLL